MIHSGEIPKEWSLANMCPLFKKGDRSLASNYRPVSLTCIPCKLLEHIVCSNIMAHLDEHELLSDRQHAFRKWHSCETQLTTVINDWTKILDKKGQVDTFILDFEKAFDTPPHELLKSKLFSYGIGGTTLNWINAFLCLISPPSEPPGEKMSFGVSPVNYSDSDTRAYLKLKYGAKQKHQLNSVEPCNIQESPAVTK